MDARLRERRGVLRVSASRHIDCSVRRRPFGSTPFYTALANLFLAAPALQMRPPSGWMRCTPQPYPPRSRTPREIGDTRPPRSRCAEQCVPSSLAAPRPRAPRPVPAMFLNEWRKIMHLAANFASRAFQKPPLISEYQLNRRSFEQRSRFRRLSPSFFKTHRSAYPKAKHAK